jgi:prepilin signal peptidase PulO-like enzyme (type II secretory pathway)
MNKIQDFIYEASIPIVILRILIDYETITSYNFIIQFLLLFGLFILVAIITNLGSFRFNERVGISNLRPGMCCVEKVLKKGRFYIKSATSRRATESLNLSYENLNDNDIKKLNELHKTGKLKFRELAIKQTMPFAPYLFLGVLLTILIRGDIITYLKILISRLPFYSISG